MITEFLKPRFDGPRFTEHTFPVELGRDLAAYKELIVELAKHLYLAEHHDRQRVPKGFEESFTLHLQQIEPGSARPVLSLVTAGVLALQGGGGGYFERARDLVAETVGAMDDNQPIPAAFPKHLLDYFNAFGRSLRDDESVGLPRAGAPPAILTPARRRALVLSAKKVYTKDVDFIGVIGETDWERHTFRLRLPDGNAVVAPLPETFDELARTAGGRDRTLVQVRGVGIYDAWDRLQKLSETHHLELLPNQALSAQIEGLATVEDGWIEGAGRGPDKEQLTWVGDRLISTFPADLPYPHLAPTPEGGLFVEWIESSWRISAEIALPAHHCEVQAVNTSTGAVADTTLNMDDDNAWEELYSFVRNHLAPPA